LTGGQSVRGRSWPYGLRLEMSKGVICQFGAIGVNVGRWRPLQADFLATDWELCTLRAVAVDVGAVKAKLAQ